MARGKRCSELDQVLVALNALRQAEGEDAMWAVVPPGVRCLALLLEEIEDIGEQIALEIALKVAVRG